MKKFSNFLNESNDEYTLVKTKEKKETLAHPDGKHIYEIHHKNEKIGYIEPYSSKTHGKSILGSRILGIPKNVTRYSFTFHVNKGPQHNEMPRGEHREHTSPKEALRIASKYHSKWMK